MSTHVHDLGSNENCKQLLSSLGEYIDGSLGEELCSQLEHHMRECQRCTVVVDTLRKTVELYHETADSAAMPVEVRQRLFLRLNLEDYLKGSPEE